MTLYGWDASDFDRDRGMRASHVTKAAQEGIKFFTHKLTEKAGSSTWIHTNAGPMLNAAKSAGIPFLGVYLVPRSGSVGPQVDFALAETEKRIPWWKDFGGWFWQVDLEHWSYDNVPVSVGTAMCQQLEQRTGKKALLYAPRWAYGNSIPAPWNSVLWNSHYVSGTGSFKSLYPGDNHPGWATMSGKTPVILQYSSTATIGGQHTCDANAYRGTEADFAKMIRATDTPEEDGDLPAVDDFFKYELQQVSNDEKAPAGSFIRWAHEYARRASVDAAQAETLALEASQKLDTVSAKVQELLDRNA